MKKRCFLLFSLSFIFIFVNSVFSQVEKKSLYELKYKEKLEQYEKFVNTMLEVDKIPGMSIAFVKGDFVWSKGFGVIDLENDIEATSESAYRLASVTKPMTAVAILQLYEEGKIDLDEAVQKYVSYFPQKKWPVTIRQLLGHLGGIPHYKNYDEEKHFKDEKNTQEAIDVFKDFDLVAEPGTQYNYSSYGFDLLGAVIEEVSGQSYGDYMKEHIWQPLLMNNTRMDNPLDIIKGRVHGYQMINGEIKNSEFVNISSRFAAGGTRSTVNDMIKFTYGLLTHRLLKKSTIDMMFTPMVKKDGISTGYGMGWIISPVNGRFCVKHTGGQPETSTLLVYFPQDTLAMAFACNLERADRYPYMERLYQLIMDEPYKISPYLTTDEHRLIYSCMEKVYNYGLSSYKMFKREVSTEDTPFKFFNKCVEDIKKNAQDEELLKRIKNGISPVENELFIQLGSLMAKYLDQSNDLNKYHKRSAITFFNDFIQFYKKESSWQQELRFDPSFEKLIQEWDKDWQITLNDYTSQLFIYPGANLQEVQEKLKALYKGRKIFPDYSGAIARTLRQYSHINRFIETQGVGVMGMELFPESGRFYQAFAFSYAWFGDTDVTIDLLRQTKQYGPKELTSAKSLRKQAEHFKKWGKIKQGIELLKIATKMHPKEPDLYNSLGEFYYGIHQIAKARRFYKQALDLRPDFEHAKQMIEKIDIRLKNKKISKQ